ncbi:GLPGLI family protein [Rhodoflexus sp.]
MYFENVRHYYNNATQEHTVQRILSDGTKLISRFTSNSLDWELSEGETRTINGVVCQKAILHSESDVDDVRIVWYAPDIPISFGSHDFRSRVAFLHGLPGLIMGIGYEGQMGGFEILLADEKTTPERALKPDWDGIEVPRQLIERTEPPKSEVKKYKKTSG